jgi:hypothetical protein
MRLAIELQRPIETVDGFVSSLLRLRESVDDTKIVYRGQASASDPVRPSIGRPHTYAGKTKFFSPTDEEDLLHRFRRRAHMHFSRVLSPGEALFIARHYGLPTRLLDWTANALYGLYFACGRTEQPVYNKRNKKAELEEVDGVLWGMRQLPSGLDPYPLFEMKTEREFFARLHTRKDKGPGHTTNDSVRVIYPVFNSPRIVAQDGLFTLHSNPWRPLESYDGVVFKRGCCDVGALYKWIVPAKCKPTLIAQLSGLGITQRLVYPDMDGIARSLWETDVLWHANPSIRGKAKAK